MSRTTLEAARDLIANAPRLSKGSYVRQPDINAPSWRPGQPVPPGTCFCVMGAVAVAHDLDFYLDPDVFRNNEDIPLLAKAINPSHGDPWMTIADWNDADGRTREDVLALFDRVIANAPVA